MATWVTHLMVADAVLTALPELDRRGFCVGNIAPDCNVENEDWSAFTPSREVTHWMQGARKQASDCDAFYQAYIESRRESITSGEELSFLLGYWAHLLTDAAFQAMIRDERRVKAVWLRIREDEQLRLAAAGMEENWDSVKKLISRRERAMQIDTLEAEYLDTHPGSGYLTEILPLRAFPDYIDYLPTGCIVRKIGVMGTMPMVHETAAFVAISRQEYEAFVKEAIRIVLEQLEKRI